MVKRNIKYDIIAYKTSNMVLCLHLKAITSNSFS